MDQVIWKSQARALDDLYMFKFRTKLCTRKKQCKNPSRCFDAHSNLMKRRVPKRVWTNGGLFNYIPEPCQEWQRSKKCSLGDNCTRSHGWLEMIYHPLLYKTKLCKSKRQNGVCIEYGFYCAKAHARSEIRCLVDIYGENWKQHYDLLERPRFKSNSRPVRAISNMTKIRMFDKGRVGIAVPPRRQHVTDLTLFAQHLLEGKISPQDQPPVCVLDRSQEGKLLTRSRSPFEDIGSSVMSFPDGMSGFQSADEEVALFNQRFSSNFGLEKNERRHCNLKDGIFMRHFKAGSKSTIRPTPETYMAMALANPSRPMDDECGNNLSFFCGECGKGSMQSRKDNLLSHSPRLSLKRDGGSILDKVFQNCEIPRLP